MHTLYIDRKRRRALIKNNLKFIIFLAVFGLVGGYFTVLYSIEIMDPALLEQTIASAGSLELVIIVSTIQSLLYAVILGLIGKAIAEKIGLWRKFSLESTSVISTSIASLVGGVAFILLDMYVFGGLVPEIFESYGTKPTLNYIIASLTYGGVVEEVMVRLFLMSLIALILSKITKSEEVTDTHFIVANIISAIFFAAGHLPATIASIGITPIIIIRCFVMNGAFGLLFGRMYRKHGIGYAMLTHAGVHLVSKIIWILFI